MEPEERKVKLVVKWDYGVEWEGNWEFTIPVEYKSGEDFIVDFEAAMKNHYENVSMWKEMPFAGHEWYPPHFFHRTEYYGPAVYTLEEWFEKFKED